MQRGVPFRSSDGYVVAVYETFIANVKLSDYSRRFLKRKLPPFRTDSRQLHTAIAQINLKDGGVLHANGNAMTIIECVEIALAIFEFVLTNECIFILYIRLR